MNFYLFFAIIVTDITVLVTAYIWTNRKRPKMAAGLDKWYKRIDDTEDQIAQRFSEVDDRISDVETKLARSGTVLGQLNLDLGALIERVDEWEEIRDRE